MEAQESEGPRPQPPSWREAELEHEPQFQMLRSPCSLWRPQLELHSTRLGSQLPPVKHTLVTNVNHHDDYNERLLHSDSMPQRLEKTVDPVWASEQPLLSVTQVSHCVGVWLCAQVLIGGWGAQAWEHLGQDPLADVLLCPFLLSPVPQAVQRRACASPHSAEAPQRSQRTLLRVISLHPAVTVGSTRSYSGSLVRARRPGAGAARVSQRER